MRRPTKRSRAKPKAVPSLPEVLSRLATLAAPAAPKPTPERQTVRLRVVPSPGESGPDSIARAVMSPAVAAAQTVDCFDKAAEELDHLSLINQILARCERADGELAGLAADTLVAQAVTLDRTFNKLMRRAMTTQDHELLSLALRTQGACRESLESLALIKHPRVSFRQTNVAGGHMQVCNGIPPPRYGPRETAGEHPAKANGEALDE